jgi:hypothetical protein
MLGILQKVEIGLAIGAVAIIGTLTFQNHLKDKRIEILVGNVATIQSQLTIKELENVNLNLSIVNANSALQELEAAGITLQNTVTEQEGVIAGLQRQTEITLVEIDGEFIPKTDHGAIQWMLDKAIGGLR